MAEYIDRKAFRDAVYGADAITMEGVRILNQFPAVKIIRCQDCENWHRDWVPTRAPGCHYCQIIDQPTPADWYCADGEPIKGRRAPEEETT